MTDHRRREVGEKAYWLDNPRNVDKVVWTLYSVCALLLASDILIHRHGPFLIEHAFGFYAFYGLFGSVGLVLTAKQLRKILKRPDNYYDQ